MQKRLTRFADIKQPVTDAGVPVDDSRHIGVGIQNDLDESVCRPFLFQHRCKAVEQLLAREHHRRDFLYEPKCSVRIDIEVPVLVIGEVWESVSQAIRLEHGCHF